MAPSDAAFYREDEIAMSTRLAWTTRDDEILLRETRRWTFDEVRSPEATIAAAAEAPGDRPSDIGRLISGVKLAAVWSIVALIAFVAFLYLARIGEWYPALVWTALAAALIALAESISRRR